MQFNYGSQKNCHKINNIKHITCILIFQYLRIYLSHKTLKHKILKYYIEKIYIGKHICKNLPLNMSITIICHVLKDFKSIVSPYSQSDQFKF